MVDPKKWWITGFDPNWKDDVDRLDGIDYPIDKDNLIMIGSVDLSQFSEEAIIELENYISTENKEYLILDDKTLWITWGTLI